ncbi:hypothetical protein INH39_01925 [Massilia violaceinigra]|uniref:RES domain-containing protein n=1 Tax=Massilia violaceinigra TaxID=2045208 RepID=A0ABY4AD82_9BURK|nr:hypothetical protein [Massilia violaceinigra]UOD30533.1 hypothetical protein INH39_01925 [Massilia violaceinigra]
MTQEAWASTEVRNPPLSTRMRRSWSERWVFLDSVDFRIHGIAFSHPDSACLAGAYASAIESDLDSLDRQSPSQNAALMQAVFPSARYDTVQADLGIDAARQLKPATSSFEHCAVSWGPEPFDGFLALLIRLPGHDIFIGPAHGQERANRPHVFVLPSGAYRHHLAQVRDRLRAPER